MKRSEINAAIGLAIETLERNGMHLPPFAHWSAEEWQAIDPAFDRLRANGLGWDITDFGSGDFERTGAVLFTLRNGSVDSPSDGTPYAEKVIIMKPGQCIPFHFHWVKTEDIINRGGGDLLIQLYNSLPNESIDTDSMVNVYCDACPWALSPGETLLLPPGASITLTPGLYHNIRAGRSGGTLICGEVSSVNDDSVDNRFAEPISRFAQIEEDEPPVRLLCNEYPAPRRVPLGRTA